ncbi:MAG: ribonuclease HII [Methanocellales archaeon]|nr:ribonuclease HII [Methanocellales archaeon]
MKIAGVDEAGKGPVIGPMIVAGVVVQDDVLPILERMGVRDSKAISPKKREFLASKIREVGICYTLEVSPSDIDALRKRITMNEIVVESYVKVLKQLKPDKAFLDAADVDANRFAKNVQERYGKNIKIISEHNADVRYPLVSAASIIAKVKRDETVKELERLLEKNIGSGYPSDVRTMCFLDDWIQEHRSLPSFVRHSWKTAKNALKRYEQSRMF